MTDNEKLYRKELKRYLRRMERRTDRTKKIIRAAEEERAKVHPWRRGRPKKK